VRGVWNRYDGTRRNPYNEIECGDHYARAMAGWSVLEALAGYRHDAGAAAFEFRLPATGESYAFVSSEGWGSLAADGNRLRLECAGGTIAVRRLTVGGVVHLDETEPLVVRPGDPLVVDRSGAEVHA